MFRKHVRYLPLYDPKQNSLESDMESMDEPGVELKPLKKEIPFSRLIRTGKINMITKKDLSKKKKMQQFKREVLKFIIKCLRTNNCQHLSSVLRYLKVNQIQIVVRLTTTLFLKMYKNKDFSTLLKLIRSYGTRIVISPKFPDILLKRSLDAFKQFWQLDLPKYLIGPRNDSHLLRGVNFELYQTIYKQDPNIALILTRSQHANKKLAVDWISQLNQTNYSNFTPNFLNTTDFL